MKLGILAKTILAAGIFFLAITGNSQPVKPGQVGRIVLTEGNTVSLIGEVDEDSVSRAIEDIKVILDQLDRGTRP